MSVPPASSSVFSRTFAAARAAWHTHWHPASHWVAMGIAHLPEDFSAMGVGGLYGVAAPADRTASTTWLRQLLAAHWPRPLVWVSSLAPAAALARVVALGIDPQSPDARKNLAIFAMAPEAVADSNPLARTLADLDRFALPRSALVVFDTALTPSDRDAVVLQKWLRAQRHYGLWWLHRPATDWRPTDRDAWAGWARLEERLGQTQWRVEFWRGPRGLSAGHAQALRFDPEGRLVAVHSEHAETGGVGLKLALDEARIVACQPVLAREKWTPPDWELVADLDALDAATRDSHAATIIVHHDRRTPLETLARAVYTLRKIRGNALKIIVREVDERLRYNHEMLLLGVGANLVVGRDIALSRLMSLIESVQGQVFTRPLAPHFESALAATVAAPVSGYQPPMAFLDAAQSMIENSRPLGLSNMLIELPLLPEVAHLDVLRACVLSRPGDIITADKRAVWVFLFACRPPDLEQVMGRVFRLPLAELFEGEVRHEGEAGIVAALRELDRGAVDYCDVLGHPAPRAPALPDASPAPVAGPVAQYPALQSFFEAKTPRVARTPARGAEPWVLPLKVLE